MFFLGIGTGGGGGINTMGPMVTDNGIRLPAIVNLILILSEPYPVTQNCFNSYIIAHVASFLHLRTQNEGRLLSYML